MYSFFNSTKSVEMWSTGGKSPALPAFAVFFTVSAETARMICRRAGFLAFLKFQRWNRKFIVVWQNWLKPTGLSEKLPTIGRNQEKLSLFFMFPPREKKRSCDISHAKNLQKIQGFYNFLLCTNHYLVAEAYTSLKMATLAFTILLISILPK